MYKSIKDIQSIVFPVYQIPDDNWYVVDGVLFTSYGKIIDDYNMPGKTIGVRRLQSGWPRGKLFRLNKARYFLDMIKSSRKCFVDTSGKPFVYTKTKVESLKYHKVTKIILKDTSSIIMCEGIPYPFEIPRPPYGDARWARILYRNNIPWLIYDLKEIRGKDSNKKI